MMVMAGVRPVIIADRVSSDWAGIGFISVSDSRNRGDAFFFYFVFLGESNMLQLSVFLAETWQQQEVKFEIW